MTAHGRRPRLWVFCCCIVVASALLVIEVQSQSNVRVDQRYAVLSCRAAEARRREQCRPVTDTADVRCCNMEGTSCVSLCTANNRWPGENRTFEDAERLCNAVERRLCNLSEYETCCATGCGFSGSFVWMGDDDLCDPITYAPTPVVTTLNEPAATRVPTPAPTACVSSVCPTPAPPLFAANQNVLGVNVSASNPIPADFDLDGDVDIFVFDDSPRLFINEDDGSYSEYPLDNSLWHSSSLTISIIAVDINFDSYMDLLVCGIGFVAYLQHCATQCPVRGFRFDFVLIDSDSSSTFECPDTLRGSSSDNGVKGVLVMQQGPETSSLRVYENRGTLLSPVWQLQYPLASTTASACAATGELTTSPPFSNVEFRELVHVEDDQHTQFIVSDAFVEQRNNTYTPSMEVFDSPIYDLDDIVIADIDRDGRSDIVGISQADNAVVWFRNLPPTEEEDDSLRFSEARSIRNHHGSGVVVAIVEDLNLDGHPDVITASNDVIQWCPNDGGGAFSTCQTIVFADYQTDVFANFQTVDIDGDGDSDILADSFNSEDRSTRVVWFENTRLPESTSEAALIEDSDDDGTSFGPLEFAGIVLAVFAFGSCCGFAIFQYRKLGHTRLE